MFEASLYYDSETDKWRWAVFSTISRTWYFPKQYGKRAAEQLARKLNREVKP